MVVRHAPYLVNSLMEVIIDQIFQWNKFLKNHKIHEIINNPLKGTIQYFKAYKEIEHIK